MTKVDKHCRLCAEPTEHLIYADEEAALNSKIAKKMLWINIDVSPANGLPKSICYSCFDQLERTWIFLKSVREAQEKLYQLFPTNNVHKAKSGKQSSEVANPVDMNWDDFQDVKVDIKDEDIMTVISTNKFIEGLENLKREQCPENDQDFVTEDNGFSSSTNSDEPTHVTVKKKKSKKRVSQQEDDKIYIEPVDIADLDVTWEEEACRCAHCDAQCKNISLLRLHSQHIHNSCCVFKCVNCGKIVSNFKSFIKHLRLHKQMLNYCCEFCDKKFTMTKLIKRHKHVEHGGGNLTCCRKCGASFDTVEQLHDHLEKYSRSIKKMFRKAVDKGDEEDLKCNLCHKEFKKRTHLNQHKLVHTDRSRDFSCHICGKMFFMKGTLSTHIMTHENVKPYKCEFCPMAFKAKGNLQSHVTLHSGTKPFVCEQCGKSFRVKRHLKSHSIIHTDLMPYKCEYCDKTFRFKTRLNLHLRQHTGAKPYNCPQCQRDFTNGSNYKKHMKRRHNIDTTSIWKKYVSTNTATEESKDADAGQT